MDTGISRMMLWVNDGTSIAGVAAGEPFPPGIEIGIVVPASRTNAVPALQYSFKTGETSQPMSPSEVVWKAGNSINTGANVLNGADYLFDYAHGQIGFRIPPAETM
jgi:subtilisin family serine protease